MSGKHPNQRNELSIAERQNQTAFGDQWTFTRGKLKAEAGSEVHGGGQKQHQTGNQNKYSARSSDCFQDQVAASECPASAAEVSDQSTVG